MITKPHGSVCPLEKENNLSTALCSEKHAIIIQFLTDSLYVNYVYKDAISQDAFLEII